ncbi:Zn(2)-Cys(6) binuclear cluster domain-containing protein [Mycena sanguinolenta]|nr:Zn(2)-Cys(6) binuclear cluster domain-containing protein [Mycena sanguinolenta]
MSVDVPTTRSKACVNCKRRKIKCDGERPSCGQCARSVGFRDCEYPEDGPSRTQILEEQISILEARIDDMEKPRELRSTFVLQNPYADEHRLSSLPRSSSSTHLTIRPPSGQLSPSEGIPQTDLETLIEDFLGHSAQFGFFLNVHNFRNAFAGRISPRPTAVLVDVVKLWAVHLSEDFTAYESSYLARALRACASALSGTHQHNTVLHTIQAEVLLSHYFFRNTRFLEGKYRLSAAVSLVMSSGLHRIRSAGSFVTGGPLGPPHALPPPRDIVDEHERINAFWTVLTLNNCWTTADGSPSNISYTASDVRIDTSWPIATDDPALLEYVLPESSIGTICAFLEGRPDNGISVPALHAKAAILFEQASRLAAEYRPNMTTEQSNKFHASFNSLDVLIENFKSGLPAISPGSARELFTIHSLVHVASIQLHNPFVAELDASRLRVLDSARGIIVKLGKVPITEFVVVNPIMGTLFMALCQVFVAELGRSRRHRPLNSPLPPEERLLIGEVDTILAIMNIFAPTCRLMESQLITMQQLYHTL